MHHGMCAHTQTSCIYIHIHHGTRDHTQASCTYIHIHHGTCAHSQKSCTCIHTLTMTHVPMHKHHAHTHTHRSTCAHIQTSSTCIHNYNKIWRAGEMDQWQGRHLPHKPDLRLTSGGHIKVEEENDSTELSSSHRHATMCTSHHTQNCYCFTLSQLCGGGEHVSVSAGLWRSERPLGPLELLAVWAAQCGCWEPSSGSERAASALDSWAISSLRNKFKRKQLKAVLNPYTPCYAQQMFPIDTDFCWNVYSLICVHFSRLLTIQTAHWIIFMKKCQLHYLHSSCFSFSLIFWKEVYLF